MTGVRLEGGSDADRDTIMQLHAAYLDANARFDWQALQQVFSSADHAEFFNLNGFTYQGAAHWTRLWQYYATQVQSTYWTPTEIGGVVDANTAVVWCHRQCRRAWVGPDQPVRDLHYDDSAFMSRSTMVFHKDAGQWRVLHAHFSKGEEGRRPGDV